MGQYPLEQHPFRKDNNASEVNGEVTCTPAREPAQSGHAHG